MKKLVLSCAIIFSLAGCAPYQSGLSSPSAYDQTMAEAKRKDAEFADAVKNINLDTADVGVKPSNYKKLIEDAIRNELKDPDSAKFSEFTTPRKEVMVNNRKFVYGYSSCVFVNAKNSYGGYTGKQLYWVFMRNNEVLRVKNTNGDFGNLIFVGRNINCS
ncbi:hypothetical protein [Yersinia frederiksenii]|uniref:hypothetical protein n=1 Tax=Yersinia TaxID=629 RepID=UPI0005E32FE1|nr:hypothetical protein [Yersinia frederiksenii]CNG79202.1 Uncharacterised protein [Yersinia frederiksenii]CNL32567.1 Uncharacterised protein [Yersinia frederiksenii]